MTVSSRFGAHVLVAIAGLLLSPLCSAATERAPSSNDDIHVTATKDGQTITVDAAFNVKATQRQAWDVLIDFDRMPKYLSTLESSKVIRRSGNILQVAQKGKESYGLLTFSFDNLRRVELVPYTEIKSHLISGSMKKSDGTTRLSSKGDVTHIVYHGVFIPNVDVPSGLGIPAIESATRKQFEGIRGEIERRASHKQ